MTSHAANGSRKTIPGSGIASRYRALLMTHGSLEEKLDAEMKRPLPDAAMVSRIKRRKLSIKDELASIDRLIDAMGLPAASSNPLAELKRPFPAPRGPRRSGSLLARPRPLPAPALAARTLS